MHDDIFARPIAHRGLHDKPSGIVENSKSAFQAAIARGFSIECDLQLTADAQPVVFHDDELERLTGKKGKTIETDARAICALPLLGSVDGDCPLPFSRFLECVAGRVPIVVEIKRQALPYQTRELTEKALAEAGKYDGPLAFKSFDPVVLNTLHRGGFRGPLGIITYDYRSHAEHLSRLQKFLLRNALHRAVSHFTFVSCERTALRLPRVRFLRARGIKVMAWTVKSPEQAMEAAPHADQIVFEGFDPEA